MTYPGLAALSGIGLLNLEPLGQVYEIGEAPASASFLRFVQPEAATDVFDHDRNALFGSLLTLASNRRCQVAPEVVAGVEGTGTALFLPMTHQMDPELAAPMPPWSRMRNSIADYAARLSTMEPADAAAITAAMRMHYNSALLYTRDITGAYALAVGGIEALASRFGPSYVAWDDWHRAKSWDKFLDSQNLSADQAAAIREKLLGEQHVKLTEKFTTYFCQGVSPEFWREKVRGYVWGINANTGEAIEGSWVDQGLRSMQFADDPGALRKAVRAAYGRRSQYIHAGEHGGGFVAEVFGDGPGRARNSLSYAQLRSGLRFLILRELAARGRAGLKQEQRFVVPEAAPMKRPGAAFFQ
ncbi:hypothetical protein [Cellulosimicrobium sp. KWT-B]|uniref:hypothetical protein n=1 Tax=Cellulosimicrobium sp. KWT-B TaxID=1981152 RepID=UPI001177B878|nr:hypothetical protein [Cellulosimicrobium sp. KWT-B]